MKKTMFKDLPDRFQRIEKDEYAINQSNGSSIVVPRGMSGKQRELLKEFKSLCGVCFGGHLADLAGTRVMYCTTDLFSQLATSGMDPDRQDRRMDVGGFLVVLYDSESALRVGYRFYKDGIERLACLLSQGADFLKWFKQEYYDTPSGYKYWNDSSKEILEDYLHTRCGAPEDCFDTRAWDHGAPSQVLRKALELNPELAEVPL